MPFLSRCPACGADAAEVAEFFHVSVPPNTNDHGYRVRCRVCGFKGDYSPHRLIAMYSWNKKAEQRRRKKDVKGEET